MWFSPWRRILRGRSGDAKPSGLRAGTKFVEEDTGVEYTYDPVMKDWKKRTAPYSALVAKDGSTVWAEDASGKTIASGEGGADDACVILQAGQAILDNGGGTLYLKGRLTIDDTVTLDGKNHSSGIYIVGENVVPYGYSPQCQLKINADPGFILKNMSWYGIERLSAEGNRGNIGFRIDHSTAGYLDKLWLDRFKTAIDFFRVWETFGDKIHVWRSGDADTSSAAIVIREDPSLSEPQNESNNISLNLQGGGNYYAVVSISDNCHRITIKLTEHEINNTEQTAGVIATNSQQISVFLNVLYGAPVVKFTGINRFEIRGTMRHPLSNGIYLDSCSFGVVDVEVRDSGDYAIYVNDSNSINMNLNIGYGCNKGGYFNSMRNSKVIAVLKDTYNEGLRFRVCDNFSLDVVAMKHGSYGADDKYLLMIEYGEGIRVRANLWQETSGVKTNGLYVYGVKRLLIEDLITWGYLNVHKYVSGETTFLKNSGTATFSGDGVATVFEIGAHGLVTTDPSKIAIKVTPASSDAIAASPCVGYVDPVDNTKIKVKFSSAPDSGANNVKIVWYAEVVS